MKIQIFVYGTLKKGYTNHHLLDKSIFIGEAASTKRYILQGRKRPYPLATPYEYVKEKVPLKYSGFLIGEIYQANETILYLLDKLEEHPIYYVREIGTFKLFENGKIIKAFIYNCYHTELINDLVPPNEKGFIKW